ncbi:hypothetical protein TcasGA2_TC012957 [Tribolium castaneum]|uniref:Uncharacterized protein n=1 Tax=Tribolium castaneum TaxID=7070 RepID=D7EKR3_TRICA|nr:hypothetical protein TcasGA2_TC012957 [Tribolium castaneum]
MGLHDSLDIYEGSTEEGPRPSCPPLTLQAAASALRRPPVIRRKLHRSDSCSITT